MAALERLAREAFDVLVIGGGATGAGIARDAALRGLRVGLCEYGDFASQTSSQSSKLIHGGLRYLQYGNLDLVFEGLAERHRLMTTAPHLCRPIEFLFPAYRAEQPSLALLGAGIGLYNALALWRSPVRSRRVEAGELYELSPLLRTAGLQGAQLYVDCQTDDARLVLETILDAETAGAVVASYVEIRPPAPEHSGRWSKVTAVDRETGAVFSIVARAVVNAAGPFVDALGDGGPAVRPTMGIHLVFDAGRVPTGGRALVLRSPRDGRLIFTLPAGARTIFGTTDTDWRSGRQNGLPRPNDEIRARAREVNYLLEAANHAFPSAALAPADVISTYAGLRPLIATSDRTPTTTPREHEIWVDRRGVLTVAGGKLTTFRRMAEEAVDQLVEVLRDRGLDRPLLSCQTRKRLLPGAGPLSSLDEHELATDVRDHLIGTYGSRAEQVMTVAAGSPDLTRRIDKDLPHLRAEAVFAARTDHACEIEDVLRRRLPIFRDSRDQGLSAAQDTADLVGDELGWSRERRARSVIAYRHAVESSRRWQSEV
jgi:glycerol-3-phosphate dehydrogenase